MFCLHSSQRLCEKCDSFLRHLTLFEGYRDLQMEILGDFNNQILPAHLNLVFPSSLQLKVIRTKVDIHISF